MKQYKCNKYEKILNAGLLVFFWCLIFISNNDPTKTILVNLFLFFLGSIAFYFFIKSFVTITLTDYSIIQKYPFRHEKEIQLRDVTSLAEFNDSSKLILKDYNGNKLMTIDKNILGALELKEQIRRKLSNATKINLHDNFRKSNGFFFSYYIMILIMLFTIGIYIYQKNELTAIIAFLISLYIFIKISKQIITLKLDYSYIITKSIFSSRRILMSDIRGIVQETDTNTKVGSKSYTVIKLINGDSISISGFKPDDELLFQSCKFYFENKKRATNPCLSTTASSNRS